MDDTTGVVTEAWTGPQVAWKMARGYDGAFGGKKINSYRVWLGFCALFLIGLDRLAAAALAAPRSTSSRCSRSRVSLWFFNRGDIFASVAARVSAARCT